MKKIGELSSSQCWEFLAKNFANSYLVDVRSKEEWEESGIPDLSSINGQLILVSWLYFSPFIHKNDDFIKQLLALAPNKDYNILFICKSGGRSAQAANAAFDAGYVNIFNVNDGFCGNMFDANLNELNVNGWLNSQLPRKNHG